MCCLVLCPNPVSFFFYFIYYMYQHLIFVIQKYKSAMCGFSIYKNKLFFEHAKQDQRYFNISRLSYIENRVPLGIFWWCENRMTVRSRMNRKNRNRATESPVSSYRDCKLKNQTATTRTIFPKAKW